MFEVLKKGLVKELEKMFNVKINENKQAKVDVYGKDEAEIKYHIYFIFSLDSNVYEAKLDVYNTTCSIGIDSIGTGSENTRLGGMTIAEYFFHTFLKNVAEGLKLKFDIAFINSYCREMASLALMNLMKKV